MLTHRDIRPWTQTYKGLYKKAASQGSAGEEELKYALPDRFGEGLSIIFHDETKCRVMK